MVNCIGLWGVTQGPYIGSWGINGFIWTSSFGIRSLIRSSTYTTSTRAINMEVAFILSFRSDPFTLSLAELKRGNGYPDPN